MNCSAGSVVYSSLQISRILKNDSISTNHVSPCLSFEAYKECTAIVNCFHPSVKSLCSPTTIKHAAVCTDTSHHTQLAKPHV